MKKQWLAVIRDKDLTVAKAAVGRNKQIKVTFLSEYKMASLEGMEEDQVSSEDFSGIKNWLNRQRIPLKKLKIALSSDGLITRVISLPQMSLDDLENIVTNHMDQYFTLNVDNYIIDYRILQRYKAHDKLMMDVLLAALPRVRMENIWSFCRYLDFEPSVIDLTADCLARVYSNLVPKSREVRSPENTESFSLPGDMAIVSLHADKIEFVLLENGLFFLYSDQEFNSQALYNKIIAVNNEDTVSLQAQGQSRRQHQRLGQAQKPGEERKPPVLREGEEIELYLSSYLEDEIELVSAQDASDEIKGINAQKGDYSEGAEVYPMEDSFNSFLERDRFLNELIGLEDDVGEEGNEQRQLLDSLESQELLELLDSMEPAKARDEQDINSFMTIAAQDSQGYEEYWAGEAQENSALQAQRAENMVVEKPQEQGRSYPEDKARDSDQEAYHLDEGILFELTKSLPQLDFSLISEPSENQESENLPENQQLQLDTVGSDHDNGAAEEIFKQAALAISPQEDTDEFILEDLFVPLENLEENLVINETQQTLQNRENNIDFFRSEEAGKKSTPAALDLYETLAELEESQAPELVKDPKKELEKEIEPVLVTLAELLSFFAARHFGSNVSTVYLTGEYCTMPHLPEIFEESLGIKTLVGFPNGWTPSLEGSGKVIAADWQKYGSLYGLAVRED